VREVARQVKRRVGRDLREDPYLPYLLVGALVLAGFWFWHLVPNFATRDERDRLLDPLVAYGTVFEDPSLESLREGVTWGRTQFAATFYLYAVVLLPVVAATLLLGRGDVLVAFDTPTRAFGRYELWHGTPAWFWTASIVLARLTNVAFAVGCVYLTYRIGTTTRDRATGRLAALLLTFTFGFLMLAHEAGEDVPALFFTLLAFYLALRYVETGSGRRYLAGCAAGGLAVAFKLTAAPVVVVLGVAYLLRDRAAGERLPLPSRPWLLVSGAALGAAVIVLGFPSALVTGSFDPLVERVVGESVDRTNAPTGPDAPVWWWFLRGYLNGLGLPLFLASVGGVLAAVVGLSRRATRTAGVVLALTAVGCYLLLFSGWHSFRVHHLLPTFPLLAVLVAVGFARLGVERRSLAGPLLAVLLVASGSYAAVGVAGYADQPRDEAVDWLDANAAPNATLGVSRNDFQDAAIPHWMDVERLDAGDRPGLDAEVCPEYVQVTRRDLLNRREEFRFGYDPEYAAYLGDLLAGEYDYELVAEFGPRPPEFVPRRPTPGSLVDLLPLGVVPRVDQYGDEQELGPNQYTAILKRTGDCDAPEERSRLAPGGWWVDERAPGVDRPPQSTARSASSIPWTPVSVTASE
jgi:hypothetical protein